MPDPPDPPPEAGEQRFRLLVDSLQDYAIFMIDLAGTITSWNAGVERVLGYSEAEFIGLPFAALFTPEDAATGQHTQELQRAITTGRSEDKREHVRKDGRRFRADGVVGVIRDAAGQPAALSKVMHDVSDAHAAAEALVRDLADRQRSAIEREQLLTQAQHANRLKDEFLSTISHELRTPLNAILGWAQLLGTEDLKLDEARRRRALAAILRNARVQVQLVDDLLDVSRIILGKMRLQIRPTDLPAVLAAAIDAVQPAAQAKGVDVSVRLDPAAATIVADEDRLQQIVWNLLANAIKFTPTGGRVELQTRRTEHGTDIIVTDTGTGIAAELLPYIFERFRQADSSTTRPYGGVGLGLAIVRHLVELHGGHVEALSAGSGTGTTFTVSLPGAAAVAPIDPPERLTGVFVVADGQHPNIDE